MTQHIKAMSPKTSGAAKTKLPDGTTKITKPSQRKMRLNPSVVKQPGK